MVTREQFALNPSLEEGVPSLASVENGGRYTGGKDGGYTDEPFIADTMSGDENSLLYAQGGQDGTGSNGEATNDSEFGPRGRFYADQDHSQNVIDEKFWDIVAHHLGRAAL